MNKSDLFETKKYKYSSRIYGLATILMAASIVFILGGILLAAIGYGDFGGTLFGSGIIALILRPLVDGFGFLVYNAENQVLKEMNDKE